MAADSVAEPTLREIAVEARLERQRTRLLSHFESRNASRFGKNTLLVLTSS